MSVDIEVRALWKSYPREDGTLLPILEGVDIEVGTHEFVALVGPSGCGKSTLLNMLAGFEKPDRGSVTVGGRPVAGPSPKGIMITQNGSVFPWMSVRRNLAFVLNEMSAEVVPAELVTELLPLWPFGRLSV